MLKDLNNKLLNRREVKIIVNASANPGFVNASKIIAEQCKAKEELICVKEVKSKFGRDTFLIDAMIYNSLDDKDKIERKTKPKKVAGAQ